MSRILFLHGASSSGKSTLARAIREVSEDPWVHLSFDTFRDGGALVPATYADWSNRRPAAFGALHRTFANFADAGFDLIVEHILDTKGWHADLQRRFSGHAILFVGLHTPQDILRKREVQRRDRKHGSAVQDFETIHQGLRYDLTLDGSAEPSANARLVLSATPSTTSALFDSDPI